jgi:hypothetical protein
MGMAVDTMGMAVVGGFIPITILIGMAIFRIFIPMTFLVGALATGIMGTMAVDQAGGG